MIYTVKDCICGNRCEGRTDHCASCNALDRKASRAKLPKDAAPIAKMSQKQSREIAKYAVEAKKFLRGKRCAHFKDRPATQVHHMQGRIGYADEWARENEVTLLHDKRFWLPVSDEAHEMITRDSKWACENGYSLLRITDPVFRRK
jgi:hypothetical protein